MSIGAFVVTRDGANLLPPVVACLRSFADYTIVAVDSMTTDDSLDVARACGAYAVMQEVRGHTYESTLNRVVDMLDNDWVFYLHDDELVGPQFIEMLPRLMQSKFAWRFPHYNMLTPEQYITSSPYSPDYQMRLIPRRMWMERGGWPEHIHASPAWPCQFMEDVGIFHYKFVVKSLAFRQQRLNEWCADWAKAKDEHYRAFSIVEGREVEVASPPERMPEQTFETEHVYG